MTEACTNNLYNKALTLLLIKTAEILHSVHGQFTMTAVSNRVKQNNHNKALTSLSKTATP